MLWRILKTRASPRGFLHDFFLLFEELSESEVEDQFLWNPFRFLSKNFLNFWFDPIEEQNIIELIRHWNKGYASVVFGDSEVIFLVEGEDAAFCQSLYKKQNFFQATFVSIQFYVCTTWTLTKRKEKKIRQELNKNSILKKILEATPQETIAEWSLNFSL